MKSFSDCVMLVVFLSSGAAALEARAAQAAQAFVPTAAAPAGAHATMRIDRSILSMDLQGLAPGSYEVTAVRALDQRPLSLGWLAITDPDFIPDSISGAGGKETSVTHQTRVLSCTVQLHLPAEILAGDLDQVLVLDHGGTVMLQTAAVSAAGR